MALKIHALLFSVADLTPDAKIEMEAFCRKTLRGEPEYREGAVVQKDGSMKASGVGCWYQEVHLGGETHEMVSLNNDLHLPPFWALFDFNAKPMAGPSGRKVLVGSLRKDVEQLSVNAPELKDAQINISVKRISDEAVRRYQAAFK